MKKLILALVTITVLFSCSASGGKKVVKPRYHHVWTKGNRYRIDIPIGNRHIRFLERKRTKIMTVKK